VCSLDSLHVQVERLLGRVLAHRGVARIGERT
jgi:hypothetical protein